MKCTDASQDKLVCVCVCEKLWNLPTTVTVEVVWMVSLTLILDMTFLDNRAATTSFQILHMTKFTQCHRSLSLQITKKTSKPTQSKGVENDASARPPNLTSRSCQLELWPLCFYWFICLSRLSVHPVIHYKSCEHDILKMNKQILLQIGTNDPLGQGYCIWDILQDLVYEGRRLPFASLQDLKEAIKNKWKELTTETVRKSTAQWKNDWMRLESRMEAWFNTFSTNHCDWILISCSEMCWN